MASLVLPSTLMARDFPMPGNIELDSNILKWSNYGNDKYGCCVAATCAQAICIWTNAHHRPYVVPNQNVFDLWSGISGYKLGDKNPGIGIKVFDALEKWKRGWDVGLLRKSKLIDYAEIAINRQSLKWAVDYFGGCAIAFECPPNTLTSQANWCKIPDNGKKTSGHAVYLSGYDDDTDNCDGSHGAVRVISWGQPHLVTWNFIDQFASQAVVMLGEEWVPKGVSPHGKSVDDLQAMIDFIRSAKLN